MRPLRWKDSWGLGTGNLNTGTNISMNLNRKLTLEIITQRSKNIERPESCYLGCRWNNLATWARERPGFLNCCWWGKIRNRCADRQAPAGEHTTSIHTTHTQEREEAAKNTRKNKCQCRSHDKSCEVVFCRFTAPPNIQGNLWDMLLWEYKGHFMLSESMWLWGSL